MNASGPTKSAPVGGEHKLFGFLTTEANAIVAPVHPKALPVIPTTPGRSQSATRQVTDTLRD
jgi:putative SOS response-associated peptidase YedK